MKFKGISLLKSRFSQPQQSCHQSSPQNELHQDNPQQSDLHQKQDPPKMVQIISVGGENFTVSGSGYHPQGNIYRDRHMIDPWQFQGLEECLIAGILCNNAQLVSHVIEHRQQSITIGNPYEGALLALAHKAGLDRSLLSESMPRVDCLNDFEQSTCGMATLHDRFLPLSDHSRPYRVIYCRSMVQKLLHHCQWQIDIYGNTMAISLNQIYKNIAIISDRGLEVMMLAKKYVPIDHQRLSHADLSSGLVLLGCMGV